MTQIKYLLLREILSILNYFIHSLQFPHVALKRAYDAILATFNPLFVIPSRLRML